MEPRQEHQIDDGYCVDEHFRLLESLPTKEVARTREYRHGEVHTSKYVTKRKFNSERRIIEFIMEDSSDSPNNRWIYQWSSDGGNVVVVEEERLASDGDYRPTGHREEIDFYGAGREKRKKFFIKGKLFYDHILTYNSGGNILSESELNGEYKVDYRYDSKGRKVAETHRPNREYFKEFIFEYDSKGRVSLVKIERIGSGLDLKAIQSITYPSDGEIRTIVTPCDRTFRGAVEMQDVEKDYDNLADFSGSRLGEHSMPRYVETMRESRINGHNVQYTCGWVEDLNDPDLKIKDGSFSRIKVSK